MAFISEPSRETLVLVAAGIAGASARWLRGARVSEPGRPVPP